MITNSEWQNPSDKWIVGEIISFCTKIAKNLTGLNEVKVSMDWNTVIARKDQIIVQTKSELSVRQTWY